MTACCFTGKLGARLLVAREAEVRPGAVEDAARRLTHEVMALGDQRAYKVRAESVHIARVAPRASDMHVTFEAV